MWPGLLIVISLLLFIPHLGHTPLRSWDEAWYAEIARNILKSSDWFLMKWNGLPYYDHPPFGFWLMTISFKIFGVSEFSARLPSAFCGIFSILLIYLIGKQLFNKYAGFGAGLVLATTPWFWLRAREGNLDIILVFTILLSIWLTFKAKKNNHLLPLLAIPLSLMLLTKTIIGIGVFPVIIAIFCRPSKKVPLNYFIIFCIIFLFMLLPWYAVNYLKYGVMFLDRNIFVTGLRKSSYRELLYGSKISGFYLNHNLLNLRNGISLWYKPFLISLICSLFFLKKKSFRILFLWLITYFFFFFTSDKTELWHFIIIYPVVALFISSFLSIMFKPVKFLACILPFLIIIYFGGRTVKGLYKDIVKNQPVNAEILLSKVAKENKGTIYIDDEYWPAAVFYSEKKVFSLPHSIDTNIKTVGNLFAKYPSPFLLLTKQWILDREKINKKSYEVLKQVDDRVLIKSN